MSKKLVFSIILSGVMMILLPFMTVDTSGTELGIASIYTNLYVVNPVYTLGIGIFAGTDREKLWSLPLITAVFFILGFGLIISFADILVYMYALCYLLTSTLAMFFIDFLLKRRKD